MKQNDRQKLATTIRALLAKTTENGATEAEALAAALKAQEIMDRFHLDHSALEMEEEGIHQIKTNQGRRENGVNVREELAASIGKFCDCRTVFLNENGKEKIAFVGLQSDLEFATWLLDTLSLHVKNSLSLASLNFLDDEEPIDLSTPYARQAFLVGAIDRIKERIKEMTAARSTSATGRALIPLKNQLVSKKFRELYPHTNSKRANTFQVSGSAYSAGQAAGNRASFGRPVSRTGSVARIGHLK